MKLGTYTTFDCPTEHEEEAYKFLCEEFEKIGGKVIRVGNSHDFGDYPSFEIDYPEEIKEAMDSLDLGSDFDDSSDDLQGKVDDWHEKANEVERAYNEKFMEWL